MPQQFHVTFCVLVKHLREKTVQTNIVDVREDLSSDQLMERNGSTPKTTTLADARCGLFGAHYSDFSIAK